MAQTYDVTMAILGGGPAGYLAAVRAVQLGASVAIIEHDQFGGVCLNRGCIPTKALLRTVELAVLSRRGQEYGIISPSAKVSWPAGHSRKELIIKNLRLGVEHLLKHDQIHIIRGRGNIANPQRLMVETNDCTVTVNCKKMLVASGATAVRPDIPGIDSPAVITSDDLLFMKEVPKSLAIIGGGVIGLEFAQMLNGLGTKVSIIETAEQVLPQEDAEIANEILKSLKRQGIQVHLSSTVTEVAFEGMEAKVKFQTKEKGGLVEVDNVLLAVGKKPVVPEALIALGAATGRNGALVVNEHMSTTVPGIYAAGDVTGGKMLAHKAYVEGRVAAENMLGIFSNVNYNAIPSCVYTHPELASVGLNEKEAAVQGREIGIGRFYFRHNGRALCLGERDGLVKVVTDSRTHVILGAQIYGYQATELISELTLAIASGIKAEVLADLVHPHPTLSEAVMEACSDAVGRAIHKA